ncbi:MAG TPA: O-antigen ligase family protein [Solirubrobacteraceae bacterium]
MAAIVVLQALVLRVLLADRPFEGIGRPAAIAIGAFSCFAVWQLLSASWSDSTGRALVEFDRTLLYLVTLVLFASLGRTPERIAWLIRLLALGMVAVCVAGLLSRTLPELVSVSTDYSVDRLSYPVTYWNALGLLAALAIVLCLHLTCSASEPRASRILAAAALPVLAGTLILTYSRGGILIAIVGVVAYSLLGRPRTWLTGVAATGPFVAIAVASAYGAEELTADDYATNGIEAGEGVATTVALCAIAAAVLRAVFVVLVDRRLVRARLAPLRRLGVKPWMAWSGGTVVVLVVALAAGLPGKIETQYDRFVSGNEGPVGDTRDRLTDPANAGRIPEWEAAVRGWKDQPLRGQGAGMYQLDFYERRDEARSTTVTDGHSLYLETLDELGLVGAVLLLVVLGSILVAFARGLGGRWRARYGALLAVGLGWVLAAGIDWHWEMPVVTAWLFAAGGLALARPLGTSGRPPMGSSNRAIIAVAWLIAAVTPFLVLTSSSRVRDAGADFARGDCTPARQSAFDALDYLSARPEPFAIVGFCALLDDLPRAAVPAMREAVSRDPRSWEYRLGLATALAAAGQDPGPDAKEALRRNPLDPLVRSSTSKLLAATTESERIEAGRDVFADLFYSYKLSIQHL